MHEGHRNRLKNRFLEEGLDGFEDHQILELLLFYAIPRIDTNEIAHSLIKKYGTLSGVFEADTKDLTNIPGHRPPGYSHPITLPPHVPSVHHQPSREK